MEQLENFYGTDFVDRCNYFMKSVFSTGKGEWGFGMDVNGKTGASGNMIFM